MVTDEMIDQALARLDMFGRKTPIEGEWQTAPYVDTPYEDESAAVIKVDSVFLLGVGRTSGRVVLIGDSCTEDTLVNSSVEAFAACAEAMWAGTRNPPDDNDDDALEVAACELSPHRARPTALSKPRARTRTDPSPFPEPAQNQENPR